MNLLDRIDHWVRVAPTATAHRPIAKNAAEQLVGTLQAEMHRVLDDHVAPRLVAAKIAGEGQRVRLARAMLRPDVRLVILDEPFRGLDFEQRGVLLSRAREHWKDATLLSISHNISETMPFARVLVIDDGRVVEDGAPAELRERAGRYGSLHRAWVESLA